MKKMSDTQIVILILLAIYGLNMLSLISPMWDGSHELAVRMSKVEVGKIFSLTVLLLFLSILLMSGLIKRILLLSLASDPNDKPNIAAFPFVPGYRLLSKTYSTALAEGSTPDSAEFFGFGLLLLITSGLAYISVTDVLTGLHCLHADWAKVSVSSNDSIVTIVNKLIQKIGDWYSIWGGMIGFYLLYCFIINVFVEIAIAQGYRREFSRDWGKLVNYFGLQSTNNEQLAPYWLRFKENSEFIYGHRTWAGENIQSMLTKLTENNKRIGSSLWFLLDFAAETMDKHIEIRNKMPSITFSYKNTYDYSKFLAEKMTYCSNRMVWIIDRDDYRHGLLPQLIGEVLLSLWQIRDEDNVTKLLSVTKSFRHKNSDKARSVNQAFFCTYCKSWQESKIQQICSDQRLDINAIDDSKKSELLKGRYCSVMNTEKCHVNLSNETDIKYSMQIIYYHAHKYIQDNLTSIAIDVDETTEGNIFKSFSKRNTDEILYPHLEKYYRHPVPKSRIIDVLVSTDEITATSDFTYIMKSLFVTCCTTANEQSEIDSQINSLGSKSAKELANVMGHKFVGLSDDNKNAGILYLALCLFKHMCNNNSNHKLVGFASVTKDLHEHSAMQEVLLKKKNDLISLDIGIYDGSVLVNSVSETNELYDFVPREYCDSRRVRWALCLSENDKLNKYDPPLDEDKICDHVYTLTTLLEQYKQHCL